MRANNFDLIRLLAALQVAFLHSIAHLQIDSMQDTLVLRLVEQFPGVPVFFVISGFLISKSLEHSRSTTLYLRNRCLRIFPALWCGTLLALASVILSGGLNVIHANSWNWLAWFIGQTTVLQFYNPEFLRAFGTGVINGSLWTIPVELQFYVLLPIMYALLGLDSRPRKLLLLLLLFVSLLMNVYAVDFMQSYRTSLFAKIVGITLLPYLYMFFLGIIIQRNFTAIEPALRNMGAVWVAIYLCWCLLATKHGLAVASNTPHPVGAALLAIAVVSSAFTVRGMSSAILREVDISYGIYIYHMVVINVLVHLHLQGTMTLSAFAIGTTSVIATLSWFLIERPFLARKQQQPRRSNLQRLPLPPTDMRADAH